MITIDNNKCVQCGRCVTACPMELIQQPHGESARPIKSAENFCITCGHCVATCDVGAIVVGNVTPEQSPILSGNMPTFEQYQTLVMSRRSIRHYKKQPLPETSIDKLIDLVRWVPTARNLLPVKWLVINDSAIVHELAGIVIDWFRTREDGTHLVKIWEAGHDMVLRSAPCLIVAYTEPDALWGDIDATIAVETLEYGAVTIGLGTCWAGYFIRASQMVPEINHRLGLTPDQTIRVGLMIGEIDNEYYSRTPFRKECNIRKIEALS